jgi:hypothetical protein
MKVDPTGTEEEYAAALRALERLFEAGKRFLHR